MANITLRVDLGLPYTGPISYIQADIIVSLASLYLFISYASGRLSIAITQTAKMPSSTLGHSMPGSPLAMSCIDTPAQKVWRQPELCEFILDCIDDNDLVRCLRINLVSFEYCVGRLYQSVGVAALNAIDQGLNEVSKFGLPANIKEAFRLILPGSREDLH